MRSRAASPLQSGAALRTEFIGAAAVFALGAALHFAFGWLNAWPPAALIAAVNESTWEHLKIAFWPGLLWAAAHPAAVGRWTSAYWAARGVGLLTVSIVIVAVFHGYTAILGRNILFADIALFGAAIALGHVVFWRCVPFAARSGALRLVGVILLIAQTAAFALFTFHPPRASLFQDPRNGDFGLSAFETTAPAPVR